MNMSKIPATSVIIKECIHLQDMFIQIVERKALTFKLINWIYFNFNVFVLSLTKKEWIKYI